MTTRLIGLLTGLLVGVSLPQTGNAKILGQTHCFNAICHRILTLEETQMLVGKPQALLASYYDDPRIDRFNPGWRTSSGDVFDPNRADRAASPVLPDGTLVHVHNPLTRKSLLVRINDAGPYFGGRTLDLTRAGAEALGFAGRGVAIVHLKVVGVPTLAQTLYQEGRPSPAAAAVTPGSEIEPPADAIVKALAALASDRGAGGAAGRGRSTRITLLPVRLRRPLARVLVGRSSASVR